jgi:EAL domain-containing protein (putative c-di-GMP-specific phosphodiesterase class I)
MGPNTATVFIVDDDLDQAEELRELTESAGHVAYATVDARQLTEQAAGGFDFILLDIAMPELDAFDLIAGMADWQRRPKLVLVSGQDQSVVSVAAQVAAKHGITLAGTLQKPVDWKLLGALLTAGSAPARARPAARAQAAEPPDAATIVANVDDLLRLGQLDFTFQPRIAIMSGRFAGFEALLPDHLDGLGAIRPAVVMAAVRQDRQVLRRLSMASLKATLNLLVRVPTHVTGAINLPADVLETADILSDIATMAAAAGVPPTRIVFELTEENVYDARPATLAGLGKLRMAGFGLAMDDVGSQLNGLIQVSHLPITEIKIDRELIVESRRWSKSRTILTSLVHMAHQAGMSVTIEGVETRADLLLASEAEADFAQGYLIARKLPGAQAEAMLNSGRFLPPTEQGGSR